MGLYEGLIQWEKIKNPNCHSLLYTSVRREVEPSHLNSAGSILQRSAVVQASYLMWGW